MDRPTVIALSCLVVALGTSVGGCVAVVANAVATELRWIEGGDFTAAALLGGGAGTVLGLLVLAAITQLGKPRAPRCGRCGYDLHGTDSRRCPECGSDFPRRER